MTLAEFLLARIAEDEEYGRNAMHLGCVEQNDDPPNIVHGLLCPGRIVVECEAKRQIAENHRHTLTTRGCDCEMHDDLTTYMDCDVCVESSRFGDRGGWCLTVRALAIPYSDHPDYRPEWRP